MNQSNKRKTTLAAALAASLLLSSATYAGGNPAPSKPSKPSKPSPNQLQANVQVNNQDYYQQ